MKRSYLRRVRRQSQYDFHQPLVVGREAALVALLTQLQRHRPQGGHQLRQAMCERVACHVIWPSQVQLTEKRTKISSDTNPSFESQLAL